MYHLVASLHFVIHNLTAYRHSMITPWITAQLPMKRTAIYI